MTKDILEQEGWKFKREFGEIEHFEKGDVCKDDGLGAWLELDTKHSIIKITTTDKGFNRDGANYSIKFNGTCYDDKEIFDMICKLIKLKI